MSGLATPDGFQGRQAHSRHCRADRSQQQEPCDMGMSREGKPGSLMNERQFSTAIPHWRADRLFDEAIGASVETIRRARQASRGAGQEAGAGRDNDPHRETNPDRGVPMGSGGNYHGHEPGNRQKPSSRSQRHPDTLAHKVLTALCTAAWLLLMSSIGMIAVFTWLYWPRG